MSNLARLFSKQFPQGIKMLLESMDAIVSQPGPLSMEEVEFLVVKTSTLNQCRISLMFHQPTYKKLQGSNVNFTKDRQQVFSKLVYDLTYSPEKFKCMQNEFIKHGYSEAQYHHALFVVGLFNYSNRVLIPVQEKVGEIYQSCNYRKFDF